jgi:hypothetical protein
MAGLVPAIDVFLKIKTPAEAGVFVCVALLIVIAGLVPAISLMGHGRAK